jgi:hypothetical protein
MAPDRHAVLITGNPGSGKTTMVAELTRHGLDAIDADDGIARWEEGTEGHRWVWDRDRLEQAISLTPGLFVCGTAINQREMLDLFSQVFLLSIDAATQLERLESAGDREPTLWQPIIDGRPVFEEEMKAVGAVVLDGRRAPSDLVSEIVQAVHA